MISHNIAVYSEVVGGAQRGSSSMVFVFLLISLERPVYCLMMVEAVFGDYVSCHSRILFMVLSS